MALEYKWRRIVRTQSRVLTVTTLVALCAGIGLRSAEATLFAHPWVLALVPVINALGENLGSVLGARLTSALHLGSISEVRSKELATNVSATGVMSLTIYGFLAVVIWLLAPRVGLGGEDVALSSVAILVVGSGVAITAGVIGLSLLTAFVSFRRGYDPDDVVIPAVASFADLLGVVSVITLAGVLL